MRETLPNLPMEGKAFILEPSSLLPRDAMGSDAIIGQNGGGAPPQSEFQQFHGDIAEEIGVNGSLSATEIANLEQYLKTRYAIP